MCGSWEKPSFSLLFSSKKSFKINDLENISKKA
jgi:hypothetical protein